jgi:NADH-quinone oxidoreductase subunit J
MQSDITFYLIAAMTVIFAVAAMTLREMVHSALCAATAFGGLALIYLQLDAEFVGFAQLLVYVGAIAILIVFAVLLTRSDEVRVGASQSSPSWISGLAIALLLTASLIVAIIRSPGIQVTSPLAASAPVKKIGEELMTQYILPLEMAGILLTAALLGAVVIAMREDSEVKKMNHRPAIRRPQPEEELIPR